jgi:hypothetical protein
MAVTGSEELKTTYSEYGIDDCLGKPYLLDELYNRINQLTIKLEKLYIEENQFHFEKDIPMNQEELQELIALKKKGLTKLKLVGTDHAFVVHKNVQNKISHDLVGEEKALSEFIDRSDSEPGRCHLYKANLHVTKDLFIPEELEQAIQQEDEEVVQFASATSRKIQQEG